MALIAVSAAALIVGGVGPHFVAAAGLCGLAALLLLALGVLRSSARPSGR